MVIDQTTFCFLQRRGKSEDATSAMKRPNFEEKDEVEVKGASTLFFYAFDFEKNRTPTAQELDVQYTDC